MTRILVGVTGGIAAFKTVTVVRSLIRAGHEVHVIPTEASLHMVGESTWEAITGHRVATDVFRVADDVGHVALARWAQLIVVIPATADTIARLRIGRADDLLTATILASDAPLMVFPAMHTHMWTSSATQDNIRVLTQRGVHIIGPASGELTSGDSGPGRVVEPDQAVEAIAHCCQPQDLSLHDVHIVISAGGTHEPIDPVRFIGNRSTGILGTHLARAAQNAGARVTLVAANIATDITNILPHEVDVVAVGSAEELHQAMRHAQEDADVMIMAAAVADYRPAQMHTQKIKKTHGHDDGLTLHLVPNPDIVRSLVAHRRPNQIIMGFAAETGDYDTVVQLGKEKARRKEADFLAINRVGVTEGFGNVSTHIILVDSHGHEVEEIRGTKEDVARAMIDFLAQTYRSSGLSRM